MIAWIQQRRKQKLLDLLAVHLNDPQSDASKRVDKKAGILAAIQVMKWLDNKGIRRCAACPSTETLRKYGERFFCPNCYPKLVPHA